mmetsp:Transcript_16385/g.53522  ORF Transcript_16385/g.53522 Transcript_16385/m.53522 type:complete len:252 (-) Transcript_16385:59-814(-)
MEPRPAPRDARHSAHANLGVSRPREHRPRVEHGRGVVAARVRRRAPRAHVRALHRRRRSGRKQERDGSDDDDVRALFAAQPHARGAVAGRRAPRASARAERARMERVELAVGDGDALSAPAGPARAARRRLLARDVQRRRGRHLHNLRGLLRRHRVRGVPARGGEAARGAGGARAARNAGRREPADGDRGGARRNGGEPRVGDVDDAQPNLCGGDQVRGERAALRDCQARHRGRGDGGAKARRHGPKAHPR